MNRAPAYGLQPVGRPAAAPFTWAILTINAAVWLLMEATGGSQDPQNLLRFGAKYGPYIAAGEYWRLATPIFLHIGLFHLLANSFGLLIFGTVAEQAYRVRSYLAVYLLAGIFGNIASYWAGPTVGAGASGALFGIIGAFGAYLLLNRRRLGEMGRQSLSAVGVIVGINLAFGFLATGIDNWAHLGGLASGFLLGLALAPRHRAIVTTTPLGDPVRYTPAMPRHVSPGQWLVVVVLGAAAAAAMTWLITRAYPYTGWL